MNPPSIIDPDQRVKFGAVQALTGMAEIALADLEKLASKRIDQKYDSSNDLSNNHRALMLAWSIVDQADLLRHLITSEEGIKNLPETTKFLVAAQKVQEVRNWMRHIPQRTSAYRTKKEPMPPVLGALSFTAVIKARTNLKHGNVVSLSDTVEYHTIVLLNTSIERATSLKGEPVPFDSFRIPVDHFVLQAFGVLLPLSNIVALMGSFCDALATSVEVWVADRISELSTQGHDATLLNKPAHAVGYNYRMIAKFNES